jgi:hypothetical protein
MISDQFTPVPLDALVSAVAVRLSAGSSGGAPLSVTLGAGMAGSGATVSSGGVSIALADLPGGRLLGTLPGGSSEPVGLTLGSGVSITSNGSGGGTVNVSAGGGTISGVALGLGMAGSGTTVSGGTASVGLAVAPGTITGVALGRGMSGSGTMVSGGTASVAIGAQPYIVGGYVSALPASGSQVILAHRFAESVTFPANFGAAANGAASFASLMVAAASATALPINQCASANDPTATSNWSSGGTLSFGSGGHDGTLVTSGGSAVAFAAGDRLQVLQAASPDASAGGLMLALAADR